MDRRVLWQDLTLDIGFGRDLLTFIVNRGKAH